MIYRFFDNCINECYIVGEGSPLPSPCLYRYTRRDLSSFSLPLRGRGTATRWKEFIAMRSFRHFLAKMTPRPLLGDACKGASHTCKSPPSRRRLQGCFARLQIPPVSATPARVLRTLANPPPSQRRPARQQIAKLIEYFIDLKEILCYHISYRNGYFMN